MRLFPAFVSSPVVTSTATLPPLVKIAWGKDQSWRQMHMGGQHSMCHKTLAEWPPWQEGFPEQLCSGCQHGTSQLPPAPHQACVLLVVRRGGYLPHL